MTATKVTSGRFKASSLLARRLAEHKLSVPAVLGRAGLPTGFFQQEKIYATTAELEAELQEKNADTEVGEQVKHSLKRSLAGKRPTLPQVARELCMSARTLQRRLTEAKITFQQLVEETRRELAHRYLRHSTVELNEAAFLLGYEDANSFFRAFHGWEGTSPGEWRMRHRSTEAVALSPARA